MPSASEKLNKAEAVLQSIERLVGDRPRPPAVSKLVREKHALNALAEMQLTNRQLVNLLNSCITADDNTRSFEQRLKREREMIPRLAALTTSIDKLKDFLKEISAPPRDSFGARIEVEDCEVRQYRQALYEIDYLIAARMKIAKQTPARMGATRKNKGTVAAENAGIGWLVFSIKKITGRTYLPQARILSETIFSIDSVTEDRLRRAYRNLSDRDWRELG